ncbi:MAG: NADH-quinone oxidoreductase subunit L, partial [Candidatus Neomarinimicrobiota bacterium]
GHMKEPPAVMTVPLIGLALLCLPVFFTLPQVDPFSGEGWLTEAVYQEENLTGHAELGVEHLEHGFHEAHGATVALSLSVAGLGILLSAMFYFFGWLDPRGWAERLRRAGLYQLSFYKFYFDEIYEALIYRPFLWLTDAIAWIDWDIWDQWFIDSWGRNTIRAGNASGWVDYNWLDQIVIDGVGRVTRGAGAVGRRLQTGRIQNYLVWALAGGAAAFFVVASI